MVTLENDFEREATTRRKPTWLRDAAKELVWKNNDRGHTYDNSLSVDETIGVILKHFYGVDSEKTQGD